MKISDPTPSHQQLVGLTSSNHHRPLKAVLFDIGSLTWYVPGWNVGGFQPFQHSQDIRYYTPIYLERETAFTRIGCKITTGGVGGTVIRLGIYNAIFDSKGQLKPDTLVLDAGTVSGESIADKEIVITQTLTAGWYFLVSSTNENPITGGIPLGDEGSSPVTGGGSSQGGAGNTIPKATVVDGAAVFPNQATEPTSIDDSRHSIVKLRV